MKINRIVLVVGILVGLIGIYYGIGAYKDYAEKKEIEKRIEYLKAEINKLENGDYSSTNSSKNDVLSKLELSNFSARSDGTFVNAYGSITNTSTNYIDEILNIAFFDENNGIIKVKAIIVELSPNSSIYFEELIGLTKNKTPIPKSAKLTN